MDELRAGTFAPARTRSHQAIEVLAFVILDRGGISRIPATLELRQLGYRKKREST
jgi:hypothetical protein